MMNVLPSQALRKISLLRGSVHEVRVISDLGKETAQASGKEMDLFSMHVTRAGVLLHACNVHVINLSSRVSESRHHLR